MDHFLSVLGIPLLACVTMAAILVPFGLHVLEREIIFIDIALAQIVAVGAIAAHLAFGAHDGSLLSYASGLGAALIFAALYATAHRRITQIPLEAVIGVSYAVSAAGALFLVGIAPGGHMHVQDMLAGSILWASRRDVLICASVFAVAGLLLFIMRKPFARASSGYAAPATTGTRTAVWDFLFYALISVVITFAARIGGVVLVFAFLIIPATISALFSCRPCVRLVIAWGTGAVGSLLGLIFADRLDFSVGPSVTLLLGIILVLAWGCRACWPRRAELAGSAGGPDTTINQAPATPS